MTRSVFHRKKLEDTCNVHGMGENKELLFCNFVLKGLAIKLGFPKLCMVTFSKSLVLYMLMLYIMLPV